MRAPFPALSVPLQIDGSSNDIPFKYKPFVSGYPTILFRPAAKKTWDRDGPAAMDNAVVGSAVRKYDGSLESMTGLFKFLKTRATNDISMRVYAEESAGGNANGGEGAAKAAGAVGAARRRLSEARAKEAQLQADLVRAQQDVADAKSMLADVEADAQ
jgi:hypothetical protein